MHLTKVNCLSAMLYNLEVVNLNKSDVSKLEFSLGRAYVKLFHVRDNVSVMWCKYYMNQLPIEMLLEHKRLMYLQKMSNSDCFLLSHFFNQLSYISLLDLCSKYKINAARKFSSYAVRKLMMNKLFTDLND